MVSPYQQTGEVRDHQTHPGDAAADRHLGCHQHRAANQHAATQRGHRNAKTAGIAFLQGQQVDTPAQLPQRPGSHRQGQGHKQYLMPAGGREAAEQPENDVR